MNARVSQGPAISVVVPMYNAERFVGRAIDSVLRQTETDFEIVVVDDGSEDRGAQVVRSVADPRIRLHRQPNGGDAAARNTGVQAAHGEMVAFLDADDEWKPGFLETVQSLHHRFPEAGLCATGYRRLYRNLRIDVSVQPASPTDRHVLVRDYFRRAREHPFVTSSSVAIPRGVFDRIGSFRGAVGAGSDRDMWARIALKYPVACSTEILALYHGEHSTGRVSRRRRLAPSFGSSVRGAIDAGEVDPAQAEQLRDYLSHLWIPVFYNAVADGDRCAASRILREEIGVSRSCRRFARCFRLLLTILPISGVGLLCRIGRSRLSYLASGSFRSNAGVSRRVVHGGAE